MTDPSRAILAFEALQMASVCIGRALAATHPEHVAVHLGATAYHLGHAVRLLEPDP